GSLLVVLLHAQLIDFSPLVTAVHDEIWCPEAGRIEIPRDRRARLVEKLMDSSKVALKAGRIRSVNIEESVKKAGFRALATAQGASEGQRVLPAVTVGHPCKFSPEFDIASAAPGHLTRCSLVADICTFCQ